MNDRLKSRPTLNFTGFSPSKSTYELPKKHIQVSQLASPLNYQQLEVQLKQEYETQYNDRILTMRSFYDMKYQTLYETVREALEKILGDDLIETMRQDSTSQEYVFQRVREMFEDIVISEREVLVDKLSSQYSYLKMEFNKLEADKRKIQLEFQQLSEEFGDKELQSSNQLQQQQETIVYLQGQNDNLNLKLTQMEQKTSILNQTQKELANVTATVKEYMVLKEEYESLSKAHDKLNNNAKQYLNEIDSLKLKIDQMQEKYQQSIEQMQNKFQLSNEQSTNKYQQQIEVLQTKLQQSNTNALELESQLRQALQKNQEQAISNQAQIQNLQITLRQQFEGLNKQQMDEQDKEKMALLNELDRMQSELESVVMQQQQSLESNYIPKTQYEQKIIEMQGKITELNRQIKESELLYNSKQDQADKEAELWKRQQSKYSLEIKDRNELSEQLMQREEQLNNCNKQNALIQQQLKMVESDYQRLQERSAKQLEYIEELKTETNNHQSESLKLQKLVKQHKDELVDVQHRNEQDMKCKNEKVAMLTSQLERLLHDTQDAEQQITQKNRQIDQLEAELNQFINIKRNVMQFQEENDQLRQQIERLLQVQEQEELKNNELKKNLEIEIKAKNQLQIHNDTVTQKHLKYVKVIKEQRKYIKRRLASEISKIKQEHNNSIQYVRQVLRMKMNEDYLLITQIVTKVKDLWNRKEIQHENELLKIKNEIFDQYSGSATHLRTAYEQTLDETQKQFEQQIENLRDIKDKIEEENKDLLHELQKLQIIMEDQSAMVQSLKNENKQLKNNSILIENELSTTLKNMNDLKESYEEQLMEQSKILKKYERKSSHQSEFKQLIDSLNHELEHLRQTYKSNNQDIENRIAKLVKQHQAELQLTQQQFQREQQKIRQECLQFRDQISQNEELLTKLYQSLDDVNSIVNQKDKQIQNLIEDIEQEKAVDQQKLVELQNKLRKEEDDSKLHKSKYQRDNERIQLQMASVETELHSLKMENKQLRQQCEQLADELEKKTRALDNLERANYDQQQIQNQEIADLHKLLSIQVANDDFQNVYSESKDLQQRVKDLQKITLQFQETVPGKNQSAAKYDSTKKLKERENIKQRIQQPIYMSYTKK